MVAIEEAILELHRQTGRWPTVSAIARVLDMEPESVRDQLLALRQQRVLRVRRRSGSRVWMPWEES